MVWLLLLACNDDDVLETEALRCLDGIDNDEDGAIDCDDPDCALACDPDGDGHLRDCDESRSQINPGAAEICNGLDDDCDGIVDFADPDFDWTTAFLHRADDDGDGFAGTRTWWQCGPSTLEITGVDCNDDDPLVNPDAEEVCNGLDDDCDGSVDVDATDATVYAYDGDGDGFGDPDDTLATCAVSGPWVEDATDCAPLDPSLPVDWFVDADGDGFGAGTPRSDCAPLSDEVRFDGDCDDLDPTLVECPAP